MKTNVVGLNSNEMHILAAALGSVIVLRATEKLRDVVATPNIVIQKQLCRQNTTFSLGKIGWFVWVLLGWDRCEGAKLLRVQYK